MSTRPLASLLIVTASKPARCAEAGLVPWALSGIRTFVRFSPLSRKKAAATSRAASSPWAPAAGCRLTACSPAISASISCSSCRMASRPWSVLSSW